jgi:mRNA interferase HigB
MQVVGTTVFRSLWESSPRHAATKGPLRAWHAEVERACWKSVADVQKRYPRVAILRNGRLVFEIAGGAYKLVASINFPLMCVAICWVGSCDDYHEIDAEMVRCK